MESLTGRYEQNKIKVNINRCDMNSKKNTLWFKK